MVAVREAKKLLKENLKPMRTSVVFNGFKRDPDFLTLLIHTKETDPVSLNKEIYYKVEEILHPYGYHILEGQWENWNAPVESNGNCGRTPGIMISKERGSTFSMGGSHSTGYGEFFPLYKY